MPKKTLTIARALTSLEEDQLIEAEVHPRFSGLEGADNRTILLVQRKSANWIAENIYKIDRATVRGVEVDQLFLETMKLTFALGDEETKNS
jgi:hypothetical protein